MWRPARTLLTVAITVALTSACMDESPRDGSHEGDGPGGAGRAVELNELLGRPDAEVAVANLHALVEAVAAALADAVPGSQWRPNNEESKTHCGEFGSTWAYRYTSQRYQSLGPIPSELWPAASQAAIDAAARHGYGQVSVRTNADDEGPKLLEVFSDDGFGGRLWLGSDEYANFYAGTGCFLSAEAKRDARASK